MKTSNFSNNSRHNLNGISVSRFPPKYFKGPEFTPLMPSIALLNAYKEGISWDSYEKAYMTQLNCLKVDEVIKKLTQLSRGNEPIILCFESSKTLDTKPCHRRLVAKWVEMKTGIKVNEWSKVLNVNR